MTGLGRLATRPATRRLLWGGGGAPLGLLAQAQADAHGAVPLWLDRSLAIAPELGLELDWVQFAKLVADAAGWLHAAGARAGETVAILKAHNVDVVALAQASARIGAVPALIAPEFDPDTVAELLARLGNPLTVADRAAIGRHGLAERGRLRRLVCVDGPGHGALGLDELRGASAPAPCCRLGDEVVAVTHTSGTTGTPKLIAHTGDSLAGQAAIQVLGGRLLLRRHDVIATCLTTAHARTLTGLGAIAAVGAPRLAMVDPDPAAAAVLFTRYRPSLIETFPNVFLRWEHLADRPHGPLANVRIFLSTFDAAHPRTIRRLLAGSERRLPVYAQAYAQSEVGAIAIGFRTRHAAGPTDDARHVGWPALALSRAAVAGRPGGPSRWRWSAAGPSATVGGRPAAGDPRWLLASARGRAGCPRGCTQR